MRNKAQIDTLLRCAHTFGKEYIMDDLINLLKKRGALK